MTDKKILFITDLIDQRLRKEREIEYYEKELTKIEERLFFLRKERELTVFILDIIEQEKVLDIREHMHKKMLGQDNESETD